MVLLGPACSGAALRGWRGSIQYGMRIQSGGEGTRRAPARRSRPEVERPATCSPRLPKSQN
ncbi:hypothetical protein C0Q70_19116 [Pomacea canaliculata]|uniref:Uncharacterized protein n=1 Tax=Pomacea canaliculata TaxID=400727 RepID=A0A2T7NIE8_POMCA|nr:hypothetical protein C0Q70_19116 [Pomacea canaliculata]